MKKLIILRGLPSSGKSTLAKKLHDECVGEASINSTDFFFMVSGEYKFNFQNLGKYHKQNLANTIRDMTDGIDLVIVDNTNTTWEEIKPYAKAALLLNYEIEIVEPDTPWKYNVEECVRRNTHGVPIEALTRMRARWQTTESILAKLKDL